MKRSGMSDSIASIAHEAAVCPSCGGTARVRGGSRVSCLLLTALDGGDESSDGAQETFDENVTDQAWTLRRLRTMADELMSKVRRERKAIRTITVRVRYSDMSDSTHGISLAAGTDLETDIYPLLPRLLRETWKRHESVRLVGLRFSNIMEPAIQAELPFSTGAVRRSKQADAARLLDELRARSLPLVRGHTLED